MADIKVRRTDVRFHRNQDFLAIWITGKGDQTRKLHVPPYATSRAWLFADTPINPDGSFDFETRGLLMGTLQEGYDYLRMCRELGLKVKDESRLYVPCSRGRLRKVRVVGGGTGFIYSPRDTEQVRCDMLPTRQMLETAIQLARQSPRIQRIDPAADPTMAKIEERLPPSGWKLPSSRRTDPTAKPWGTSKKKDGQS